MAEKISFEKLFTELCSPDPISWSYIKCKICDSNLKESDIRIDSIEYVNSRGKDYLKLHSSIGIIIKPSDVRSVKKVNNNLILDCKNGFLYKFFYLDVKSLNKTKEVASDESKD